MVAGIVLVLMTWAVSILALAGLGSVLLSGLRASVDEAGTRLGWLWWRIGPSLWWGLGAAVVLIESLGLLLPLRSALVAGVIGTLALLSVIAGVVRVTRGRWMPTRKRSSSAASRAVGIALAAAAAMVLIVLAAAALGPVTNYDSGLYHLGAIAYAGDAPTIPGLANLYFPFGYSTSTFPVAAFLGNGPWAGQGFRLLNGLLIAMAVLDLLLRFRRPRPTVGAWILLTGLSVALVPLLWMPDYWVTSPTSDTGVMVLTLVSAAYLADALQGRRSWIIPGTTAALLAVILTTMRPLMAVYAAVVIVILGALAVRRRSAGQVWGLAMFAVVTIVIAAVQTARDIVLSGWVQYPLSLFPVQVPWRAADPVLNRTATLGAARDPGDLWNAAHDWQWVLPWVRRLPTQWEFPLLVALGLGLLVLVLIVRAAGRQLPARRVLVSLSPAVITALVWFLASPPSFRFAWGPLFAMLVIPIGWALFVLAGVTEGPWRRTGSLVVSVAAVGLTLLGLLSLGLRVHPWTPRPDVLAWQLGGVSIDLPAVLPPIVSTHLLSLDSGLVVRVPADSDQCWAVYPLCTPQVDMSVTTRGSELAAGFAPE